MAISFLLAPCRFPLARTNVLQPCASKKDIWLGKVQRSLGKKRFVNRPLDRTPAKSRRRIGRLRQFQRRARAACSRLEPRGYAYGPKNQIAPRLPRLPGALVRCGAAHVRRTRQIEIGRATAGFCVPSVSLPRFSRRTLLGRSVVERMPVSVPTLTPPRLLLDFTILGSQRTPRVSARSIQIGL